MLFLLSLSFCTSAAYAFPQCTLISHEFQHHNFAEKEYQNKATKQFNPSIYLKELVQSPYYTKVLDAYQAPYTPNKTTQQWKIKEAHLPGFIDYPEQFIITLPNAHILGNKGLVITEENCPFFDYVLMKRGPSNWKIKVLKDDLSLSYPPQPEKFDGAIALIVAPADYCFYHWMHEMLPRLKILHMSGVHYDKIFIGSQNHKYKKATLDLLGICDNKIIYGEENTYIKANSIIVPSMPNVCEFTRPTWVSDFLRGSFLNTTATTTPTKQKRIYIARRYSTLKTSLRMIINEQELVSYLETKGFETVLLENLSIKEQTELFNSAEIILKAHGASLTNLVFCNSIIPVTVIEIFPPARVLDGYTLLSEQLNNDRGFHFNHICYVTSNEKLSPQDQQDQNLYVELDQLEQILNKCIPI